MWDAEWAPLHSLHIHVPDRPRPFRLAQMEAINSIIQNAVVENLRRCHRVGEPPARVLEAHFQHLNVVELLEPGGVEVAEGLGELLLFKPQGRALQEHLHRPV